MRVLTLVGYIGILTGVFFAGANTQARGVFGGEKVITDLLVTEMKACLETGGFCADELDRVKMEIEECVDLMRRAQEVCE